MLVDRDDESGLGTAIGELLADDERRARLRRSRARARASGYPWEATAAGIMRVLAAEAERHRR